MKYNSPLYRLIRTKTIVRYVSMLVLVLLLAGGIVSNLFSNSKKAEAWYLSADKKYCYIGTLPSTAEGASGAPVIIRPNDPCGMAGIIVVQANSYALLQGEFSIGSIRVDSGSHLWINTAIPTGLDQVALSGNLFVYGELITYGKLIISGDVRVDGANALITHEQLLEPIDFDPATNIINDNGNRKIVDLTIGGTLTLRNGGQINVTGKGYPGGKDVTTCNAKLMSTDPLVKAQAIRDINGKGGGGGNGLRLNNTGGGGGGGYGGAGGDGVSDTDTPPTVELLGKGGGTYNNSDISDSTYTSLAPATSGTQGIDFGSGGGGFCYVSDGTHSLLGGSGGGRIKLVVNTILITSLSPSNKSGLFADGASGGRIKNIQGGSGSGGTIKIQLNSSIAINSDLDISGGVHISGGGAFSSDVGQDGNPGSGKTNGKYLIESTLGQNITAKGGDLGGISDAYIHIPGGTGGGGRIYISAQNTGVSVLKTLEPVSRNGNAYSLSDPATYFNPYALQKNDIIKVNLTVSPVAIGANVEMVENMLVASSHYCEYVDPSLFLISGGTILTIAPYDSINKILDWHATANASQIKFSYQCKVK